MDRIAKLELELIKLQRKIEGFNRLGVVGNISMRDAAISDMLIQVNNIKDMLLDEYRKESVTLNELKENL